MTAGPPLMTGVRNRCAHLSQVRSFVLRSGPLTSVKIRSRGDNIRFERRDRVQPVEHWTGQGVAKQRAQKDKIDCKSLAKRRTDDTMIQETQITTRAAARNVKGPDKTHTKWKCRTKGDDAPSGPSARISQMGRCPDPGPIGKGEIWQAEGIEKIHMKLWKCRIGGCNKTFHRKGDAVRHLQTTARHNGKAVVCNCGASFSRHDALKRHQRLCNGDVVS
ncbi:hypothetical protein DFH94DRAFT_39896 [Russula ochroleuca]|jgi:hypothetical protein|uniref:C2H2-type domain-containing protein n=1 Tax=Russula ochroleuca TaxID=152965 RepID=A0A9P5MUJ2_9AGAM|nr:hypothetical protein DFH94DRAFT_39896 [Russula ochroleuca]